MKYIFVAILLFYGKTLCVYCRNATVACQSQWTSDSDFPLVESDYTNPISKQGTITVSAGSFAFSECGLKCSNGGDLYGITKDQQSLIDAFKVIGTTISFIAILFLFVNQLLDQKFSNEKFSEKPLLHHCPYFISGSVFCIMILMTLGEVIGKDNIVCNLDDDSIAFYNPFLGSHNGACTVQGILFYNSLLYYCIYTVLLSFVIFRQFYRPFLPLWNISNRSFHIGVLIFVLLVDIIMLATSSLDGVKPMGVCLPGPAEKSALLWFVTIPFMTGSTTTFIFLIAAMLLLRKSVAEQQRVAQKSQQQQSPKLQANNSTNPINAGNPHSSDPNIIVSNTTSPQVSPQAGQAGQAADEESYQTFQMRDLLKRMGIYCLGVTFTLALIAATGISFYTNHESLRDGMYDYIECKIAVADDIYSSDDIDCDDVDRARLSPFWFISWIISCLTAVLAQLILSCHVAQRDRFKKELTNFGTNLNLFKMVNNDMGNGMGGNDPVNQVIANIGRNNNNNNKNNIDDERSNLHGAEGYRTGDGTIVGTNRRISDFNPNENPSNNNNNQNGNNQNNNGYNSNGLKIRTFTDSTANNESNGKSEN